MSRARTRSLPIASLFVFLLACGEAELVGTNPRLPNAAQLTAYSQTLSATGGDGDYTWSIAFGSLPSGLSLSPDGALTGTTSDDLRTWDFTVEVASADGQTSQQKLSITTVGLPFQAQGIVESVPTALSAFFSVGDTFTVTYSFDVSAPDLSTAPTEGRYDPLTSVEIQIDSYACTVDLSRLSVRRIVVLDNSLRTGDRYRLTLIEDASLDGTEGSLMGCPALSGLNASNILVVELYDRSATALSSTALPTAPLDVGAFEVDGDAFMLFHFYDPTDCFGLCTRLEVTAKVESVGPVE